MKIIFCPQIHAEKMTPDPSMACISICEPGYKADLNGWDHLIRINFDDVDKAQYPDIVLLDGSTPSFFTQEMAAEILDFVDKLPEPVGLLVVHCYAGISRSAAVSMMLHRYLEMPIMNEMPYTMHNRYVAKLMRREINKRWGLGEEI